MGNIIASEHLPILIFAIALTACAAYSATVPSINKRAADSYHIPKRISTFVSKMAPSLSTAPRKLSTYVPKRRSSGMYQWPNLLQEAKEMALASFSQYPITFLRREAKLGNLKDSDKVLALLSKEDESMEDGKRQRPSTYASDIIQVVEDNCEYIKEKFDGDINWLPCFTEIDERATKAGDQKSIAFKKIDHEFEEKRAAYGINIDRNRKRVTIVFRGTYNDGTDDWKRNLQFGTRKMKTPSILHDANQNLPKELNIHQGFYEYMFDNSDRGEEFADQRYEEILDEVVPILKENPGFKLYITGHSLGGALGTLTAFKMAASNNIDIPKPITCVSVGSPLVGDETFRKAFQELEKIGWVRKLRVTNYNDPIPFGWPVSLDGKVYEHVGINLKLFNGGKFELSYPKADCGILEKINHGLKNSFLNMISYDPIKMHSCNEYVKRIQKMASSLKCQALNGLYNDNKLVGNLNDDGENDNSSPSSPSSDGVVAGQGSHYHRVMWSNVVGSIAARPAHGSTMFAMTPGYSVQRNPRSTMLTSHVDGNEEM